MENNEIIYKKFEEECRRYLYDKQALKELEKRFVRYQKEASPIKHEVCQNDPFKRYRLLQAHVKHVDDVFRSIEKTYGTQIARKIRASMLTIHAADQPLHVDESYQKCVHYILNNNDLNWRYA